jgi:CRP-like cAMP-binding protein
VTVENLIISNLPSNDRSRLLAVCDTVDLLPNQKLSGPVRSPGYVYFPTSGSIALLAQSQRSGVLGVAMVGREGMIGAQAALGIATAPWSSVVHASGVAHRVSRLAFQKELARSEALTRTVDRYLYVLLAQLVGSSTCLRYHLIAPRLARWLLMSQDRARDDTFPATHELLSQMLGVRRVGVTIAAGVLQRADLIQNDRGVFRVLDRKGLKAAACDCYRADQRVYSNLMT